MKIKYCFILNYAPHYRKEILERIDTEFDCIFFVGDKTYTPIKKLDFSHFKNKVKELPFVRLFKRFYTLKGLISLTYRKYDIYVLTGQTYDVSSWFLLFLNKVIGRRTYIWNHGLYGHETSIQKRFKKLQFNLCSGYFLYGNFAKKLMIDEGYTPDKLHVIYNSLEYKYQKQLRGQLQISSVYQNYFKDQAPVLIFIGRLTAVKKLEMLIETVKLLKDEDIKVNCVLIGDGLQRDNLKEMAVKKGIESNVWFYGACYDEPILAELVYNASICVSPGNIGLTAIHSLMYGCPAITHNNFIQQMPEVESIEEGVTGAFFEYDSTISLKETIKKWLQQYPIKEKKIIDNCFSIIDERYNPVYQISKLKAILYENTSD
ncbi:MAG: glycosyltransferase [Flavobacteriaceae bacterium]